MKVSRWIGLLALAWQTFAADRIRNYETHDYFALHLDASASPLDVAQSLGAFLEGPLGELENHYIYSAPKHASLLVEDMLHEVRQRRRRKRGTISPPSKPGVSARQLAQLDGVLWSEKQKLRHRLVKRIPPPPLEVRQGTPPVNVPPEDEEHKAAVKKLDEIAKTLDIQDPIFKEQWHLFNSVQLGHDLNVTGVWLQGIRGNGSITSVIDDGLDMYSDDLKDNYFAPGSHDFNDPGDEPRPRLFDDKHGTRCAGEIAAVRNNVCGVGMAYDGKISGVRILSKAISDEDEALAVIYDYQENQIYSCSWGPPDDGMTMEEPGILIKRAMVTGVQKGRQGHGSVYVFAAGNGAAAGDNCNFDGYTNSIYSVTVGGIDRNGNHPYYSELCSAQLVVTYSSGASDAIHTTDVGVDKCYTGHGGTSAAGPLVAGTIALALGIRPDLTWRDVQYLCIEAAIPFHLDDSEWQDTSIGKKFSHTFGYGKMDAWRFIEAAKTFKSVKPQAWYHSPWLSVQHEIPQGDQGLASFFDVTNDMLKKANLERLEHVTITINVNHTRRGDLSVELRSPAGVTSHIATARTNDAFRGGYEGWTFMSVAHW
jgi:kexin